MEKLSLRDRISQAVEQYPNDPFRLAQELKKLLRVAEKEKDVYSIGKLNLNLAICIVHQGRRDSIIPYAYKAVSILEKLDDPALLSRSYNLLGIAYAGQGNYQRALDAYNKALKLIRGRKSPGVRKITLLNNIGDAYFSMGVFEKSLKISLDCLSYCRENSPEDHTAIVLYAVNIFDSYISMKDFKKGQEILIEVRQDAEALPDSILLCGYYTRMSCAFYANGDALDGAKYADLMLKLVHSHFDSYEFHSVTSLIVSSQIQIGDFERAKIISDTLTEYAENSGHALDHIFAKRVLGNICYASGDYDRALVLYKELNVLYEEWMNEQKAMQYEAQKSIDAANREILKLMNRIRASEEKAERDPLTGLMNRSALVNVTSEFIEKANAQGKMLGGVFLDIDYFKEYNDSYGHAAGDEAIKFIAKVCMDEESSNVRFFRYGGDEYFGIVLGSSDEELRKLALRISHKIRASGYEHLKNPNGQRLTVSVGIVNVDMKKADYTILDIIKFSDEALYHAKDRGKDDVFEYRALQDGEHEFKRIECAPGDPIC